MDFIRSEVTTERKVVGPGRHVSHIGVEMHNDRSFQNGEPAPDMGHEETVAVGAVANPNPDTSKASLIPPKPVAGFVEGLHAYHGEGVLPDGTVKLHGQAIDELPVNE